MENYSQEEMEYFKKITNGVELSESELSDLVWEYSVDEVDGECGRWTQSMKSIVELCGKYFAIDWERGLTEHQEHEFYNQPYKVCKIDKMRRITEWVKPIER